MSRELQVGVKALIQDNEDKILLLERDSSFAYSDRWDIPGGRITIGEPHLDGLKREIHEETGLDFIRVKDIFYVQDILRASERHVVRITYLVEATGEIRLSHEHVQYAWLTIEDIPIETTDVFLIEAMKANKWIM